MSSATTDVIAARVPKHIAAQVRDQADHDRVTVSEVVHRILADRLQDHTLQVLGVRQDATTSPTTSTSNHHRDPVR